MGRIISDPKPLEAEFIPDELPHREREMKNLQRMFFPVLEYSSPANAMIMGKSGIGKTVLSKRFMKWLDDEADRNKRNIKTIYLSCLNIRSDYSIMLSIMKQINRNYSVKGTGIDLIKEDFKRYMNENPNLHLVLILDEANLMMNDTQIIGYLTRAKAMDIGPVSLILISIVDVRDKMDPGERSSFGEYTLVHLRKYNRDQLSDIINQRITLALHDGGITDGARKLILDGAMEREDARVGVELLRKSAHAAEKDAVEQILPDHVRLAKADSYPWVSISKIGMLDFPVQLLLFTVAGCLRKDEAYVGTDELRGFYADACGRNNVMVNRDVYFKNLDVLEKEGFVDVWKRKGQTSLVSLPDCPAYGVEEMVLEVWKKTGQKYTA
ncbi:MAG: AAA family ATPase [Thermoplasmatales archaeon]|nr:AAA family ATPase [Thermoplasmatales archaeon]